MATEYTGETPETAKAFLIGLRAKHRASLREALEKAAEDAVVFGREARPWQDRTGDARAGLNAVVEDDGDARVTVRLRHGVPYGVHLERNGYGILAAMIQVLVAKAPEYIGREM